MLFVEEAERTNLRDQSASINSSFACMEDCTLPMVEITRRRMDTVTGEEHRPKAFDNVAIKYDDIIQEKEINGNIMFRGITRETKAKFIRLSEGKPPKEAWEMIKEKWDMKKPSMIISVTGGAKDFKLHDNLKASFKATIQKASQLPGACIISGGTYTGVMKLVSDAFKRGTGVCLGITAWDSIIANDVSIKNDRQSRYVVGSWLSERGLYLDYKHTHFILVKETTQGKGEMKFRAELERYMIEKNKCPAVMLVVNGGWGTLETIQKVASHGSCPIVVVQKSGRVADLLAYALKHYQVIMEKHNDCERHVELYQRVNDVLFGVLDDAENQDTNECYRKVIDCLQKKSVFSVAEMGSENDIDAAVINALLAGNKDDEKKETFAKLKLTLLWDRADYARTNIFSARTKIEDDHLDYMMILALSRGNQKYVELLMDYGVNMFELLTIEILEFIYGYQSYEDHFPLTNCADLKYREQDFSGIDEDDRNSRKSLHGGSIKKFWKDQLCPYFLDNEILVFNAIQGGNKFEDPFWELFMWAVVCNLPEMAKFLWPFGRDQMAKALFAAEIWKRLGRLEDNHEETTKSMREGSSSFNLLAKQLLDQCFTITENDTIQLLTTTLRQVPNMTCLDIAGAIKHYEFIAHSSVQMLLTDVWTGQIEKRQMKTLDYLKVSAAIICPFLVIGDIKLKAPGKHEYKKSPFIEKTKSNNKFIEYLVKLRSFYFNTPVVTFILSVCGSLIFLSLYSYISMMGNITVQKSWMETLLIVWVLGHLVGEIYQISQYDTKSYKKLCYYIMDDYNKLDAINIAGFFFSWAFSFHEKTVGYAHTFHAMNCGCWILRFMTVMRIHSTFGLYLEMVQEMIKELFWFLFILFAVIISYTVTSTSLLYPGIADPMIILRMFMRSWFHVYGEYFIELPPEENMTHLTTPLRNSYDEYVAWVIFGFYLLMTNIILLNIIIASFNTTYANIQDRSSYISKYRRYDLIVEYSKRASTPAPLSLFHHFFLLIMWMCKSRQAKETIENTKMRRELDTVNYSDMEELREFEYYCAKQLYTRNTENTDMSPLQEGAPQDVSTKIEKLEEKVFLGIERMEERIFDLMYKMEERMSRMGAKVDHINQLQEEMAKAQSSGR